MKSLSDEPKGLSQKLKAMAAAGEIQPDATQMAVARQLDSLLDQLAASEFPMKSSALGWLFAKRKTSGPAIKGLYIHGSVGRGKTMLMDLFFDLAPVAAKRRAHFHTFMADVHARLHKQRQAFKAGETKQADPIPPVAEAIYREARLLCFDEFSITDIADASILARLFSDLFARGCVLVATSNVEPDNLYLGGQNRDLFLPFIPVLKQYCTVISLDGPTDYRMLKERGLPVYYAPADAAADKSMDAAWAQITGGKASAPDEIQRLGRAVAVPRAVGHAARFSFADLCEAPLGAADYAAIADRYHTIFLDHVPLLSPEKRNETKRFIMLVDTLYDRAVRLFVSAADQPEKLLTQRKGTEGFEFDRTVSRLFEMRSSDFMELHANRVRESKTY